MEPCLYRYIAIPWVNKNGFAQLVSTLKSRPTLGQHCTSFRGFLCCLFPKSSTVVGSWAKKIPGAWKPKPQPELAIIFKGLPNLRNVRFPAYHGNIACPIDELIWTSFVPNISLTTLEIPSVICPGHPPLRAGETHKKLDLPYTGSPNSSLKNLPSHSSRSYPHNWHQRAYRI